MPRIYPLLCQYMSKYSGVGTKLKFMRDILITILILIVFFPSCKDSSIEKIEKPNVLFIIADDLGPMLGSYNDEVANTPKFR